MDATTKRKRISAEHVIETLGPKEGYFKVGECGPFWPAMELTVEQAEAVATAWAEWRAHLAEIRERGAL